MMIQLFKIVALLEGISLLALFLFAMPMKYFFGRPEYIYAIGMAHGVLFIAYIAMAFVVKFILKWSLSQLLIVWFASLIPFGTFYVERKYLRANPVN